MPRLLIVDDEESICWGLKRVAESLGCQSMIVSSAEAAMHLAVDEYPDVIALDVRLPGIDGLSAMEKFRQQWGEIPIIIMTAFGDLQTAVTAVRNGAFEYVIKPFDTEQIRGAIRRALDHRATALVQQRELAGNRDAKPSTGPIAVGGFIAQTPIMQQTFNKIALAASAEAAVLLHGESGTGKELAARAIHRFSSRATGPFVVVNVASLNPTLAESELFGHVRGAFTGADQNRVGMVELANGGTLFLDEVAEIPLAIQVKLLRVLEQKEVVPVGSSTATQADFRIVAATHQDLSKLVQLGRFRHDLFFRLTAFQIELPPLRDRRDDIVPLARYFLGAFAKSDQPSPALLDATEKLLKTRPWHGNVRELKNAIEHALIVSRGQAIAPEHIPPPASTLTAGSELPIAVTTQIQNLLRIWAAEQGGQADADGHLYEKLLELVEPPVFAEVLQANLGQLSNSARLLGLHRTTLRKKVNEYRLE